MAAASWWQWSKTHKALCRAGGHRWYSACLRNSKCQFVALLQLRASCPGSWSHTGSFAQEETRKPRGAIAMRHCPFKQPKVADARCRGEVHYMIDDTVCATTPLDFQGEVLHRRDVGERRRLQELCGQDSGLALSQGRKEGLLLWSFFLRFSCAGHVHHVQGLAVVVQDADFHEEYGHLPLISRPSTWILRRWTREHEQHKHTAPCRGHPSSSNSRPKVLRLPPGPVDVLRVVDCTVIPQAPLPRLCWRSFTPAVASTRPALRSRKQRPG